MLASKIYVSTSIKKSLTKDIEKKEGTILKEKCIWKEIERVADGELFLCIKKDVFIWIEKKWKLAANKSPIEF